MLRRAPDVPRGQGRWARDAEPEVRAALTRFVVLSLLALVLLTGTTLVLGERIARAKALEDARIQAMGIANRLAAPLVDARVRAGEPGASDQLDTVMANRMRDGSVRHVKIWDVDGRLIWTDQTRLLGRTFELSEDVEELFGTRGATAELSELEREENVAEQAEGELLEVYAGAFDADGEPLVFEAYLSTERMEENARTIVLAFVPLIVGALVLLLLVVLPLAVSLSRRVQRAQAERANLMRHAALASELERRRIAEDLHHGVVQDLAGLVYTLPTLERHLQPGGDLTAARGLLERTTDLVQRNVLALRSLMTDIYPPDLEGEGLARAVEQLVHTEAAAAPARLRAEIDVQPDLDLPADAAQLAYRVVREGVRNVVKHADAGLLRVEVGCDASWVRVRVLDDGRGPGEHPGRSPEGHLGLRLLTDTVRDVGGAVEVRAARPRGTELRARFPLSMSG